jgi:uncharacterized protein YbjT (DUF2867 family)
MHPGLSVPFMRAKGLTEERLRASSMPFTILAPNSFMEVWIEAIVGLAVAEGRPVTLVGEGRRKHSVIAIADVAAFAVASVGHPAAINVTLPSAAHKLCPGAKWSPATSNS